MNIRDQLGYALPRAALRSHPKLRGLGKDAVIAEDFDIGTLKQSVIALDSEGLIASWSEGAEKLFGYTAKEIIGKHVEVIHVRSREALDQEVMTPLLRDGRLDFLSKLVRKSGETFDGHILASVVTSPDGKVTGMVGQILDFAQRQLAEDTLEKHQQMISVSPDMMSLVGPGYRYLAVNDTYETMLGCSKEEIIGHQVWEFTGQEKFDRYIKPKLDAGFAGISGRVEGWFDYPDIGQRYMDIVYEPVREDEDAIIGVAVSIRDMTDRRRAEIEHSSQAELLQRTEETLEKYRQMVLVSPDMLSLVGPGYRYLAVNDTYMDMLRRPMEEIIGHQVQEFTGQDKFEQLIKPKLDAALGGISGRVEGWFDYPVIGQRYMDIVYEPVRDSKDVIIGIAVSIRDMTDRRRAEIELTTQAEFLQRAEKSAGVGHFRRPFAGGRSYWSNETYRIFGVDKESFVPTRNSVFALAHPDDINAYTEVADAAEAQNEGFEAEVRVVRPDGEVRHIRVEVEIEVSDAGEPIAHFGVIRDITDTIEMAARTRKREADFGAIRKLSTTGIFRTDQHGRTTYVNERCSEILGLPESATFAKDWTVNLHPDDRENTIRNWENFVVEGISCSDEYRVVDSAGNIAWVFYEATPEFDQNGEVTGYLGFIVDVTERKLAEASLKESDARYRDLYDNAPFAYVSVDPKTRSFTNCNKAFTQLLGYSNNDLTCMTVLDLLPDREEDRLNTDAIYRRLEQEDPVEHAELQLKRKDGKIIWGSLSVSYRRDAGGNTIERRSTVVDITDRRMAEEALKDSEQQLNTVTSMSPVALVQTDRDGLVTFVNEAYLVMHGREREEMLSDGWADAVHPDDVDEIEEEWRQCVKTGNPIKCEYRIIQPSGRVIWVFGQTVPVRDQDGEVVGYVGTLTDITDQKGAELTH